MTVCSCKCIASESLLTDVIEHQKQYFHKLLSIQCNSTLDVRIPDDMQDRWSNLKGNTLQIKSGFITQGNMFRCDTQTLQADGSTSYSAILAYNGKRYQKLNFGEMASLDLSSKSIVEQNPYGNMHPLLVAFGWAFTNNDSFDLSTISNPEIWSKLIKNTVEVYKEEKEGHSCIVWVFNDDLDTTNRKSKKMTIFFAEDLDYFPIASEVHDSEGKLRTRCTVTEFKRNNTEDGEVVFPVNIEAKSFFGPEADIIVSSTSQVDPQTLKINDQINEDVFTLPLSQADYIYDADLGHWLKTPHLHMEVDEEQITNYDVNLATKNIVSSTNVTVIEKNKNTKQDKPKMTVDMQPATKTSLHAEKDYSYSAGIIILILALCVISIIAVAAFKKYRN